MATIPVLDDGKPDAQPFAVGTLKNPRWENADKTAIGCTVTFPNHPAGVVGEIPFTASPHDSEAHGRGIFYRCVSGEFGPVAAFVGPTDEALADTARETRSQLLRASDWSQLPDVPIATQKAYQTYRQALRDISDQPGFPATIDWPVDPQL